MSTPQYPEAIVEITRRDLDDMIESAARRGAEQALSALGLDDKDAVKDVDDLRGLIGMYREARSTAIRTAVKAATMALLAALAIGVSVKLGITVKAPPPAN